MGKRMFPSCGKVIRCLFYKSCHPYLTITAIINNVQRLNIVQHRVYVGIGRQLQEIKFSQDAPHHVGSNPTAPAKLNNVQRLNTEDYD